MPTYKTGQEGQTRRTCECGNVYFVDQSTSWKTSCFECWKLRKERAERLFKERYKDGKTTHNRPRDSQLETEFQGNLRAMIQLCHPDKHGGSEVAKRITQWLLSKKE